MGGQLSKARRMRSGRQLDGSGSSSSGGSHQIKGGAVPADFVEKGVQYTAELNYYEAACRLDPELELFDSKLQQRTSHVISTVALGVELRSLSFNTLTEITGGLLDTNKQVVDVILECKEDIWKNPELFGLVKDYFECSIQTLDYCNELEKCLKKARDSLLVIQFALRSFEEEANAKVTCEDEAEENNTKKYTMTVEKLRQFKAAGNPFTDELSQVFQSVYRQQTLMLRKLLQRKKKLDKKLKTLNSWRKVSNVIFVAALTSVIICSIVAAAVAAPPVAAAMAAASAIPIGSMGRWINSLLKKYQDALQREQELVGSMQFHTMIALKDLDTIRVLVNNLEIHFNSQLENAAFALRDEEAVLFVIEDIKKRLEEFMTSIDDLGKEVDRCTKNTTKARTLVLQKIMKPPR